MATSLTLDELVVVINAQTKDFQRQVALINDQLEGVGKQSNGMSKKSVAAFGLIAGAAQSLVSKGINLVTGSIGYAVKRIDTLNNSQNVFKNLGFSVQDTKKQMDILNDAIDGLPTALNDAVSGVEALASVQGNLGSAVKTYKAINDGILAMGGSADMVNGAILQLSQLPMDGPLDAQTWNSLRQNGLAPVFTAMAKDSHMSVSELKDAFGKGELTVKDFTDKLIKLDKDGGGGMASLEKQARDSTKGIGTSFNNVQIAVGRALASILTAIGRDNISGAFNKIKEAILKIGDAAASAVKVIKSKLKEITHSVSDVGDAIKRGDWSEAGKKLAETLISGVKQTIDAVFDLSGSIMKKISQIDWGSLGIQAAQFLVPFFLGLAVGIVNDGIPAAFQFIMAHWQGTLLALLSFMFAPEKFIKPLTTLLGKIPFAGKILVWIVESLQGIGDKVWDAAKGLVTSFYNGFREALGLGPSTIIKPFIQFLGKLPDSIISAAETVYIKGLYMMERLGDALGGGVNKYLVKPLQGVKNVIITKFSDAGSWLRAAGSSVISGLRSGISSAIGSLGGILSSAKDKIVSAFTKVNWKQIGIDIIKGIGSGISSMAGWLADQAKSAVGGAVNKLKSFLGIHSPSRVMRDEVGKMIGLGVAEGINRSTRDVVKAASNNAKQTLEAYGGSVAPGLPSLPSLSSRVDIGGVLSEAPSQPQHIVINIGGEKIIDTVVKGINTRSFMNNNLILDF